MPVTFNNLVNDTGGNLDGTLIDKAELQLLLLTTIAAARTDTGAVNNWAPGLDGNTYVPWNGAADVTISGLAGGVAGQIVWGKNLSATKVMYFLHASGLSSAANQFNNIATSGATPVAPGGLFGFLHNGTAWQLFLHAQGALVTPSYAAGNFAGSAGTWTVDAGDVGTYAYLLTGRNLKVWFALNTTSVAAPGSGLNITLPAGFTSVGGKTFLGMFIYNDNGGATTVGQSQIDPGATAIRLLKFGFGNWTAATNTTGTFGLVDLEVV
jgi:hypothetical protein